jgi:hypothetical protein
MINAEKIVRQHPGDHDHISIEKLELTGNYIECPIPKPELHLYYQIKWNWAKPTHP